MPEFALASEQAATGWLLIISGLIFAVGGTLFAGRAILKWPVAAKASYLRVERGFVIAAILVLMTGLTLLDRRLEAAGDTIWAPIGWTLFLIATAAIITAETIFLSRQDWIQPLVLVFIVLAFLGQAILGAAIMRTGLLPVWVGWATILWNLGWLVILPIARPGDRYYPWLFYTAPLVIGIVLLQTR